MIALAENTEVRSVSSLLKAADRKFPSDGQAAKKWFERQIWKELGQVTPEQHVIVAGLLALANRIGIGDERHKRTVSCFNEATKGTCVEGPNARGSNGIRAQAEGQLRDAIDTMLDWEPGSKGKKLRDYIGSDPALNDIKNSLASQGRGALQRAYFLHLVQGAAGDGLVGGIPKQNIQELLKKSESVSLSRLPKEIADEPPVK